MLSGSATTSSRQSSFLADAPRRVEEALERVAVEICAKLDPALVEPVAYALSTSGKRLRPVLCVLAYAVARRCDPRELPPAVYALACSIEIVHTYSLVHDDLPCMDDDDLRRGRPTLHRAFSVRTATLAGAALIPAAMATLLNGSAELGLSTETSARLVRELTGASGTRGMVGGQLMDLEAEGRDITAAELESIHRRKTGALLASALRIGAIAGEASPDVLERLTRYGELLGLAFQIADDLLDVEGESDRLGKTAGRDVELRKSSYPSIHGVEVARSMARENVAAAKEMVATMHSPELLDVADFVVERAR